MSARAGFNRFVWNFRGEGSPLVPGYVVSEIRTEGPAVPPGTYQVKLTAAGQDLTAPLVVTADPRSKTAQADFEKQYEWGIRIRDRVTEIQNTVMAIIEACTKLVDERGMSAEDIAARFAVTAHAVRQRLRLAAISPRLMQVYRDGGTELTNTARSRGAKVIDGLEILISQGAASFERWTGRTAPVQAMREVVGNVA